MIDFEWRANQYDDSEPLPIADCRLLMEEESIATSSPDANCRLTIDD